MASRLLLVEDEPGLVMTLTDRLMAEGYDVEDAGDFDSALRIATDGRFDAILLDVMLPGGNGFDICRTLRARGVQTPVLMLTARGQVVDRVVGLKLGADDYLTKPFETAELLARIEALLRRARVMHGDPSEAYSFGDVEIDFRGASVTRDELLEKVWGYDAMPVTRTVDVHVAALHQKIGAEHIITVHGLGY